MHHLTSICEGESDRPLTELLIQDYIMESEYNGADLTGYEYANATSTRLITVLIK